ncbi:hypothetical protein TNCV_3743741 [Trichonephila clavipes]|nr:hypothetical protein TNCV_3743741 [Trichonephila clavipes]
MQVTVRFCTVSPQFRGRKPCGWPGPPTSLPFPPTTREDLWLYGYLESTPCRKGTIHLQTSMSSPGFEPSPSGTAVSVANHYTCSNQTSSVLVLWNFWHEFLKKSPFAPIF